MLTGIMGFVASFYFNLIVRKEEREQNVPMCFVVERKFRPVSDQSVNFVLD